MPLSILVNGQVRQLTTLDSTATLTAVVEALELKADRIAVELNGSIVRRSMWLDTPVEPDARLEIVHFVGGGL